MLDLNDLIDPASGWVLTDVRDINNHGQIVGYGTSPQGHTHGFPLTPVPETSSMLCLGMFFSLGGLYVARRRK